MGKLSSGTVVARLDAINEFDREPVASNRLQGPGNFIGIYSGEHVAGTEFVIGPLFVAHGVTAGDLLGGLLVGNLLAVLSWAFICAPIAVRTRLNLYWKLRKIAGPYLLLIYNLVNALMFCFLAGAMISVAATAVGIPFDINMPGLSDLYPTGAGWVATVLVIGCAVTLLAILGFEKIARFSKLAAPWLLLVFVASALAVLPQLGVGSWSELKEVADTKIWTGAPMEGRVKFTFWHVTFFAWFANMAMHIGMADMTLLRYARKWQYGFASAFGMYLGHFIAWIASGILVALAFQENAEVAPGPIAYMGAGVAGLIAVVLAGWTTANPTIYRAGLAVQTITPNWKRWKVTLVVGLVTSVAALFPALMMRLLDFVALYGLLLMPMGAIIFADFWICPKLGLHQDFAERTGRLFSWPAGLTWLLTLGLCLVLNRWFDIEIFFLGLPGWFIATALYLGFAILQQRRASTELAV